MQYPTYVRRDYILFGNVRKRKPKLVGRIRTEARDTCTSTEIVLERFCIVSRALCSTSLRINIELQQTIVIYI